MNFYIARRVKPSPVHFAGMIKRKNSVHISAHEIIDICANVYNVSVDDVKSRHRKREKVDARHFAMYFMRTKLKLSFQTIADFFCRDHATVCHACKKVRGLLSTDRDFYSFYIEIFNEITSVEKSREQGVYESV